MWRLFVGFDLLAFECHRKRHRRISLLDQNFSPKMKKYTQGFLSKVMLALVGLHWENVVERL